MCRLLHIGGKWQLGLKECELRPEEAGTTPDMRPGLSFSFCPQQQTCLSFIISVMKVEAVMRVVVGMMTVYYLGVCVWYCVKEPEMKPFMLR